jgi:ceramide glucosyltransferase
VIQQAIQEYPDVEIGIVFSDPEDARSVGKLKDMIAGYGAISHDVLVFSDSDAHALPTFLREMLACTGSLRIGLGFGAPAYGGSEDWGAALIAVCANSFVLRLASMCLFGAFDEAVGTTMAVRRDVIEQIGGLQQFGRQVTDDLPLARAIRHEGYRIHLLKQPARIANRHYGFKRWWSHLHRWIMIIRHYWPNNFLITGVVDLAPWWALFYLALTLVDGSDAYPAVFLLAAVPGASVFSAAVLNTRFAGDEGFWRYLWVVSVLEFLRLPLLIYSGLTSVIVWRGRRLHTIPDCTTTMVAEHAGERAECRPPGRRG